MKQEIKQLTQREHVLLRPSMYCGSIVSESSEEFIFNEDEDKFDISTRNYVPGLLKLFNEIIDNSIDAYIKSKGTLSNKISIKMTNDMFECLDNGSGIPNTKMKTLSGEMQYQATVAFTEMLSGNNYDNDDEASLGTNGIGSKLSFIFSKKAQIINDDGKKRIIINTRDNLEHVSIKEQDSKSSGVHTKIWPDLEYFGLTEIDEVHQNIIKERLLHLSISYPGITFRFNGKSLKINVKNYFKMFDSLEFLHLDDNVSIAVGPSKSDQFEHFSLVNGLVTKSGGSHVNFITNNIVSPMRDKLIRKFKTIKPADVKSKLRVIVIFRNFMNARYTSQTKEEITNSSSDIKNYLGEHQKDFERFVNKIQKNEDIMIPITELFLLREQAKINADLKRNDKKRKKPKSEKFMPPIGNWDNIFLCEGDSASLNASQWFDRTGNGFYAMFGVPPNSYNMKISEIIKSNKMTDLQNILNLKYSETSQDDINFKNIILMTDFDLPGHFIAGQLLGLFYRFGKNLIEEGRIKRFVTPLILVKDKKEKIISWFYDFEKYQKFEKANKHKNYSYDYKKGLGSWDTEEIDYIIQKDGMDKMMEVFVIDEFSDDNIDSWLNGSRADKRKEMLDGYSFNIMNT